MNLQETKAKLEKYNQSQLLKYYDELDENQRQSLLKQIDEIDFDLLKLIEDGGKETEKGVITPLDDAVSIADIEANKDKYTAIGTEAIKEGKVAALLLAGGMGTRLGSDKPKGMYNIGLTRDVYIFEMLIKNLMDVVNQTGAWVPLYIMTSEQRLRSRQTYCPGRLPECRTSRRYEPRPREYRRHAPGEMQRVYFAISFQDQMGSGVANPDYYRHSFRER